jgi:hypothetical protein
MFGLHNRVSFAILLLFLLLFIVAWVMAAAFLLLSLTNGGIRTEDGRRYRFYGTLSSLAIFVFFLALIVVFWLARR